MFIMPYILGCECIVGTACFYCTCILHYVFVEGIWKPAKTFSTSTSSSDDTKVKVKEQASATFELQL